MKCGSRIDAARRIRGPLSIPPGMGVNHNARRSLPGSRGPTGVERKEPYAMHTTTRLHFHDGDWPEVRTHHTLAGSAEYVDRDLVTVEFGLSNMAMSVTGDLDQIEEIAEQLVEIVNMHRAAERAEHVEAEAAELAEVES